MVSKPLFACATASTEPFDAYSTAVQPKTADKNSAEPMIDLQLETGQNTPKPKPSTFASIITGGRSPTSDAAQLDESMAEATDTDEIGECRTTIEPELISTKMLKRKRRIEFNTTRPLTAIAEPGASDSVTVDLVDGDTEVETKETSKNSSYAGFQKGDTQFGSKANGDNGNNHDEPDEIIIGVANENDTLKSDICSLKDTLEAKVKFLCQDRPDVSPVQVIQIQMEVERHFCFYFQM